MLKVAGLSLIVLAGAGMGFGRSYELTLQERELAMLFRMVILLKGEIRYGNASLYDAFCGAAEKMSGNYKCFLLEVAKQMNLNTGKPFERIFQECGVRLLSQTKLDKKQQESFLSLGNYLGYLDLDMQLKQLELYELELTDSRRKLREELPGRKKLYQSLGLMGGILFAVLLW